MVGPKSVGYRISEKAKVKGGDVLTLTDFAVRIGRMEFGDSALVADLTDATVDHIEGWIREKLADLLDRMKTSAASVPIIVVGGGAALVPDELPGVSRVIKVEHAGVANAIGAAMAQVSGECDQVFYDIGREQALEAAQRIAEQRAIDAGGDASTMELLDVEDVPMSYIPGNPLRVRLRVIANLAA